MIFKLTSCSAVILLLAISNINQKLEESSNIQDYYIETIKTLYKINDIMEKPIEVFKHKISKTPRIGVGGKPYTEKLYSVHVGGQRVTRAVQLGYSHIEAIVNE